MSNLTQHYKVLELKNGASLEDIKQAYKDLVMVWHPDRFPGNARLRQKAQDKLKQINKAYEQLRACQPTPQANCHRAYTPRPAQPPPAAQAGARKQTQQTKSNNFKSAKKQFDPIISFQQAKAILAEYHFKLARQFPDCCICYESGPFCLDIREHIPEVVLSVPCASVGTFHRALLSVPCKSVGTFHELEAQALIALFRSLTPEA